MGGRSRPDGGDVGSREPTNHSLPFLSSGLRGIGLQHKKKERKRGRKASPQGKREIRQVKLKESNRSLSKIVLPRAERPLEEGNLVYLLLGDLIAPTDQPLSGRFSIKNSRLTGGERERGGTGKKKLAKARKVSSPLS